MRRTYRQSLGGAALASLLALGLGCDGEEKAKSPPPEKTPPVENQAPPPKKEEPATKKATVTGTVERVMAIGGDTTGWQVGRTEVTAHPALNDLAGKKVRVTGTWFEKTYVERGAVRILKVETVEEIR